MSRSIRQRLPTAESGVVVQVTDDGSRTLVRTGDHGQREDAYHSASGAVAETRHVYLENSGIADRLRRGQPASVLEVGLGTGMGMLMSLEAAIRGGAPLRFVALENRWLPAAMLHQLEPACWVRDGELASRFLQWRDGLPETVPAGRYRWSIDPQREVEVHVADARHWTPEAGERFDAIYFDPFAPATDPELWQRPVLERMRRALSAGGRLTSYCVSRPVREAFASAGFAVERVPGPPGGKREVLVARPVSAGA